MAIMKLITLLCCTYFCVASHHSHSIPVEGYDTELKDLGQHVEIPETPVRVVKITKTVAVKVPVPYPVKVVEKVPYPVHVSKPYPVPVPQIVKVPHVQLPKSSHEGYKPNEGKNSGFQIPHFNGDSNSYQVKEDDASHHGGHSFSSLPESHSFGGGNTGYNHNFGPSLDHYSSEESPSGSYDAPPSSYYGSSANDEGFEDKTYDLAIKEYLHKHSNNHNSGSSGYDSH